MKKMRFLSLIISLMLLSVLNTNAQLVLSGTSSNLWEVNNSRSNLNGILTLRGGTTTTPFDWQLKNDGNSSGLKFMFNNSLTPLTLIDSAALFPLTLGIGSTVNPSEKLQIHDGNMRFFMPNGAGRKGNKIEWYENASGNDIMQMIYVGQNMTSPARGFDRFVFASGAWDWNQISETANTNQEHANVIMAMEPGARAVGIGTLNPRYRLDVTGAVNATEYRLNGELVTFGTGGSSQWITNGTNIHYSAGNVGIGIASPTQKLDVNGNVKLNGDLTVANTNSTLPVGLNTQYADGELLSNHGINFLTTQPGYNQANDGAAFRIDMRTTTAPVFQWFHRPANQPASPNQLLASISKEGNFWSKYLSVSADYPDVNQQNEHLIAGTVAHFDGRVYVSEAGGSEKGFANQADSNYQNFLLWVEEGIVSKDFAIANTTDWPDYVFAKTYKLPSLSEVEKMIKEKGHLPTMPSATEVEKNGFTVNDMTKRMVKTIEELTLHAIDQEKQIIEQKKNIELQHKLINDLMQRLEKLERRAQ